ncbi:MAG: glycosyltransferase family 2 protein [Rikenellaceae bacterium]|nr:glycosyltransferase family 2 protein [Rikenellaceae bacterium]
MKRTAVVILNWNGRQHLEQFLPSVVAHTPQQVRIIVADNGSTDDSVAFLAQHYPTIEIIRLGRNYGFAEGYNRALEQVDAEFFILLNSDVEVTAGWVEPLVATLTNNRSVAAVAPKLRSYGNRDHFEYAGAAGGYIDVLGYPFCRGRILSTLEQDKGQYDTAQEVFWASGAAFCCRADVFRMLGGFDADFFAHMEEIDLCWRMQLQGYKIMVEPHSTVYHLGGGTMPNESPRKLYLNYRNNLSMLFKCAPTWQRILVAVARPVADMLSALIYLLRGDKALAKATIEAYRDFFALHGELNKKRKAVRSACKAESDRIYRGSIVMRYAVGKRFFGNLMK